jgi:hypothetical protein
MPPASIFTQALAVLRSFSFNKISDREFQRQLDVYRLFIASKCSNLTTTSAPAAAASTVDEAKSVADSMTHEQRLAQLLQHAEAGALRLLLMQHQLATTATGSAAAAADVGVEVQRSSVPGAGLGLFARAPLSCGSVITFHPGKVYTRKDTKDLELMRRVTRDNDYTFFRDDGVLFDAFEWADGAATEGARGIALGHMINHPPAGRHANAAPLAFDYGGDWPPTSWRRGRSCSWSTASTPGCAACGPRGTIPWTRARCSVVGA